jgi:glutaminyl-tRNA synthetase
VLDPIKLIIDNYPAEQVEDRFAPNHPQKPELGKRTIPLTRELWIEREDFEEIPERFFPFDARRNGAITLWLCREMCEF